jgi:hypothetical protein
VLSNSLPTLESYKAALWYFCGPGQWHRLGEITVSPKGIRKWTTEAQVRGLDISWEGGIHPGWSYVFPMGTGPDDFLFVSE